MAPEIIVGEPYSFAADVFSYGIVLIEIITRKKITQEIQRKYRRTTVSRQRSHMLITCPAQTRTCLWPRRTAVLIHHPARHAP